MSPLVTRNVFPYFPRAADAALTLSDGTIYVFYGSYAYVFAPNRKYPYFRHYEEMGLNENLPVDAALLYPTNNKVYLFQVENLRSLPFVTPS